VVVPVHGSGSDTAGGADKTLSGPATDFVEHTEPSRGHGRTEERILRTTPVTAQVPIDFPHAAQVFRVIRYVGGLDDQRRTKEVAYCVTSLTSDNADATDLAGLLRDHWGAIENKLHWVRDTTFNEDASTLRTGTAPQAHGDPQHPRRRVPAHRMDQPQTGPPPLRTRRPPMRRPHHQTTQNGQTSNMTEPWRRSGAEFHFRNRCRSVNASNGRGGLRPAARRTARPPVPPVPQRPVPPVAAARRGCL